MIEPVEEAWLEWAWAVLATTPPDHLRACQAAGGEQERSAQLSPGYLGSRYRPGGVLATALAHGPGPRPSSSGRLQAVGDRWLAQRAGDPSTADKEFLREWRVGFEADQDSNDWWQKHLGWFLHDQAGLERQDLAIANLAPCRMTDQGQGARLARLCQSTHPFSRLLAVTRPAVIVCPSVVAGRLVKEQSSGLNEPLIVDWNGRTFEQAGRRRAEWVEGAIGQIRHRLRSRRP